MCGIAGFYNHNNMRDLESMSRQIAHRGPDDEGTALFENVGLAFRRLSILDLNPTGHQPMVSQDGRYVIIYNGEVYNFQSLRVELERRGHSFRSTGDTEVILHAFIEYGVSSFAMLSGMFAFAIYDTRAKKLWLVRDRFGIKPLYYFEKDSRLFFASELKAFNRLDSFDAAFDEEAVPLYFRLQYIPAPRTIFRGVRKLLPGHYLVADGSRFSVERFAGGDEAGPAERSHAGILASASSLLEAAVRSHAVADVPIGVFLSGGIDSSLVAAMLSKDFSDVNTFSIVFDDALSEDESTYSRRVAGLFRTKHHEFHLSPHIDEALLHDVAYQLDEPMADPAAIPTYLLARETAKQVKVVLTGEGADEVFGGYKQYGIDAILKHIVPRFALKGLNPVIEQFPSYNIRRTLRANQRSVALQRFQEYTTICSDGELRSLLTNARSLKEFLNGGFAGTGGSLNEWLRFDMKYWLPDDLLMKADKMLMRFGLEGRVPYLDKDLVSFVSRIDAKYKVRGIEGKWLLKKIAEKYLPRDIIYRRKHGFNLPLSNWFRRELKQMLLHNIAKLERHPFFYPQKIRAIARDHLSGRRDNARLLYAMLVFSLWSETYRSQNN